MENLVELNKKELREVEGGLGFWPTLGAGLIVATFVAVVSDWENFKAGLSGEPPVPKN